MQVLSAAFGEVAGQDPQQLVQIGAQRAVRRLLDTEILEHRYARRGADPTSGRAQQGLVDAAALRVVGDRHVGEHRTDGVRAVDAVGKKLLVAELFLDQYRGQRCKAPRIGAGAHAEMEVGQFRGIGDHRIDHDHRSRGILCDLVEHDPGPRKALRHPGILADEHRHLGVFELPAGVAAVEVCVHPVLTGLLLRQRIRAVPRSDRLQERATVGATEMVALTAATVIEDLVATVLVSDLRESLGDLGNRGVPVDLLVTAVGASAQWRRQPVAAVLVVVEPKGLVARVALRSGMLLVTADLDQPAVVDLHDDTAVALAQDAGRRLPLRAGHLTSGHLWSPFRVSRPAGACATGGGRRRVLPCHGSREPSRWRLRWPP